MLSMKQKITMASPAAPGEAANLLLPIQRKPIGASFANYQLRVAQSALGLLTACLVSCGGGGDESGGTAPPPPGNVAATESRAVALSKQTEPTGVLTTDEPFAVALVHVLQTRWTPSLRDVAQVTNTWPYVQGNLGAADWSSTPREQPPVSYGAVLASGNQLVARVYRCESFDAKFSDFDNVFAPVPALDALTLNQRSALSTTQFTANLLLAVSANRAGAVSVFKRPGQITVGDSFFFEMNECSNRKYGSHLPAEGELSVTTGRVESTLVSMTSINDQLVGSTVNVSTRVNATTRAVSGTFYVGGLGSGSVIKDDVRVHAGFVAPLSSAEPLVSQAELLAPAPGAAATGSTPVPTLRVRYDEWRLDLVRGVAVEGSVVVTDRSGNSATITPAGSTYQVTIRSGSQQVAYTVTP